MPIYEFVCQACGKRFSDLVPISALVESVTCACGSDSVTKVVSSFRRGRTEDEKIEEISVRFANLTDDTTGTEMEGMMREVGKALDEDASEDMVQMFQDDMGESLESLPNQN